MTQADDVRLVELERADARRRALHEAIGRIQELKGNELYQRAWKHAETALRSLLISEKAETNSQSF